MGNADKLEQLRQELDQLVAERNERKRSIPAHSIRPHQLLILEELDERIQALRAEIEALQRNG